MHQLTMLIAPVQKFYSSCPGEGKEVNLLLLSLKVFKAKAFWN
jgi:hypothetical protein